MVAFMSTAPKAASFAVLIRLVVDTGFAHTGSGSSGPSAVLSMCVGNFGAILQSNVKRMLAYSSIAHAGYLMVAFASASNRELGISATMFYSAAYAAMNVGAFAVITQMAGSEERLTQIDDYSGLGKRSPVLAAALTFFLLVADRDSHHRRLFRQVLRLQRRAASPPHLAHHYWRSQQRHRLLLLPARDCAHVHVSSRARTLPLPRYASESAWRIAISLIATLWLGVLPNVVLHYTQGAPTILAMH